MLYVSHSLDEIQHLADKVLVLEEGRSKPLATWKRYGAAA
jgi:ABC-type molybdate transport system ATPase subunit